MIAARRVRAHSALFAALACVAALLAGLAAGLVGHLDSAALDGVRGGISALAGDRATMTFDAPKASADARAAQLAHAGAILDRELPAHVRVTRADTDDDFVWVVRADAARIVPADLAVLARSGGRIHAAMIADDAVAPQGVDKSGGLDAEAKALAARVAPLAGIQPVPLLLVAAIGLVTLAELARLLDGVRLRETALLRSRGASATRIGWTTALESLVVAGAGAVLGSAIATGALLAFGEHPLTWPLLGSITLAVVAISVVLVAGVAVNSARLAFRRDTADDSGRARKLAAPGLVVLLVAAAGLSLWRYLEYGSPLSPTSAGARVDPVAVLAPALCLAAVAVLCLAVFPAIVRLVERSAARRDGVRMLLVAGQLARRARMTASPIVLIALAGGGLVLAACYTPTWQAASARTAALHSGADFVVTGAQAADAARVAKAPGIRTAAPALQLAWTDDDGRPFSLVALDGDGLRGAVSDADGAVDPAALASALRVAPAGPAIPDGATALDVKIETQGLTAPGVAPTLSFELVDGAGTASTLSGSPDAAGALHLALPSGSGRRLGRVAVDVPSLLELGIVSIDPVTGMLGFPDGEAPRMSLRVSSMTATGGARGGPVELGSGWRQSEKNGDFQLDGSLGFTGTAQFEPTSISLVPAVAQAVPLVVSPGFAAATRTKAGSELTLEAGSGVSIRGRIARVETAIPGARGANAAVADLAAVQAQRILEGDDAVAANAVWASADAGALASADAAARTSAAITQAVPGAAVTGPALATGSHVLDAVPVALWLGMAGGSVLALIALAAVAGELLRLRSDEVGVLRALGFAPRTLARLRQGELGAAVLAALVGAAVAGAAVSLLVVPGLTRVAIEDPIAGLPLPIHVDALGLGLAGVLLAAAAGAIIAGYGRRVAQQARTVIAREGAR